MLVYNFEYMISLNLVYIDHNIRNEYFFGLDTYIFRHYFYFFKSPVFIENTPLSFSSDPSHPWVMTFKGLPLIQWLIICFSFPNSMIIGLLFPRSLEQIKYKYLKFKSR